MKLVGIVSTATLSLLLGMAALSYAQQDQHDQQQEQKDKPAQKKAPENKNAKPEGKTARQQDENAKHEEQNTQQQNKNNQQEERNAQQQSKNTKQDEKSAQQLDRNNKQEEKNTQQTQRAGNRGSRIPDDRFHANFGREHAFRVSQADYSRDRRFQYGGYWFGFVDAWPTDWLYTQDVFVVEIDGVYYLCNPMYPGINVTLSIAE